jgi:hypothetical protein
MSHIHWVAPQNKLEIPNDEEEVNTEGIRKEKITLRLFSAV